ncbi:MAG: TonB family protein [Acidobacteriota bacterium]
MQDRVAEILLERQSLGAGPKLGILASVALHGTAVLMVVLVGRGHMQPSNESVITMKLMPAQDVAAKHTASRRDRAQEASSPRVAPTPRSKTAVQPSPKPGKVDPARSADKTLFGKSEAPAVTKASPPSAAKPGKPITSAAPQLASSANVPAIGTAGVSGLEGGDFPYAWYIERMLTLIGTHWFRPQSAGESVTRVYFVIERNGSIREVKIESSTGNSLFDRAANRAVIEASPLPPLPIQYSGSYLGVHLTFH